MNARSRGKIFIGVASALALLAIAALFFSLGKTALATTELHVCSTCFYTSVQAAVDAASEGDIIKVAAGRYADVSQRPRNDVVATGVVTQMLYVSKTVTILGGYDDSNWGVSDPVANPTVLDAQGEGRVIYITNGANPTIRGLQITGGQAAGLAGDPWDSDAGGGIYGYRTGFTLENSVINDNHANVGGGIYLFDSPAVIEGNNIYSNTAGDGGGFLLWVSAAEIRSNKISGNTAWSCGGGIYLDNSPADLTGNMFSGNTAWKGAALMVEYSVLSLVNNVIVDNHANVGGGVYISSGDVDMFHTTIVANSEGIHLAKSQWHEEYSDVSLVNTIFVSHTIPISVESGSAITVNGVLWDSPMPGLSGVSIENQYVGDPCFTGDGYHIAMESAAKDKGVLSSVSNDIDGQSRLGLPDLGADEFVQQVFLPLVIREE